MIRRNRAVVSALTLVAGASLSLAVLPVGAAQAVTNGLGIHAVTKTVIKGDTARIKGKVVGAGKGVKVTIQQRRGGSSRDWGSGRTVTTDSKGKFIIDRKIKGKFTRDYRACLGSPGKRKCSLRARIEVVPKTTGIFVTTAPANVNAGTQLTATGSTDAALVGRTLTLEQYKPKNLKWLPVASSVVAADSTFSITGTPVLPGKGGQFRVTSPAYAGQPAITVSGEFLANVFGYYPLANYAPTLGGFKQGPATFRNAVGTAVTYPAGSVLAPSDSANTVTVNLEGNCNRFMADVFLDDDTAAANDSMNTSVDTAIGATMTNQYTRSDQNTPPNPLTENTPLQQIDLNIANAQQLRISESPASNDPNFDPVWYGNPFVACAY